MAKKREGREKTDEKNMGIGKEKTVPSFNATYKEETLNNLAIIYLCSATEEIRDAKNVRVCRVSGGNLIKVFFS